MRVIPFVLSLLLFGCSFQKQEEIIPRIYLNLPDAVPLELKGVHFTVANGLICTDPDGYKNMAENLQQINSQIEYQKAVTQEYRKFYESELYKTK